MGRSVGSVRQGRDISRFRFVTFQQHARNTRARHSHKMVRTTSAGAIASPLRMRTKPSVIVVCAVLFGNLMAARTVLAQDTTGTGSLSGTIRDTASAPVAF